MFMEIFTEVNELFDLSNSSKESNYCDETNKLFVGKKKDETCGVPIKSFVGSKAKIYTYIIEDDHEYKKVKGTNKKVVNDELKFKNCKNNLSNATYMKLEMNKIQSINYNVETYRNNNISLPCYIDKKIYT